MSDHVDQRYSAAMRRLLSDTDTDMSGELRLCIGMLKAATKDMRKPGLTHNRVSGCAWLASSAATPWFDYASIDQRWALEQFDWTIQAADILRRLNTELLPSRPLPESHLRVIAEGLEKLTP